MPIPFINKVKREQDLIENEIDMEETPEEKLKRELNSNFPFACLWEDEQEANLSKILSIINLVLTAILIVVVLMK